MPEEGRQYKSGRILLLCEKTGRHGDYLDGFARAGVAWQIMGIGLGVLGRGMLRRTTMDADEPLRATADQIILGEDLSTLAIAELEARVSALKEEIARVEVELKKKQAHGAAAASLFKS